MAALQFSTSLSIYARFFIKEICANYSKKCDPIPRNINIPTISVTDVKNI